MTVTIGAAINHKAKYTGSKFKKLKVKVNYSETHAN